MEVKQLLCKSDEQDWNMEFDFQDNGSVAGSLKFQSIFGLNPKFSEIKTTHRKERKKDKEEKKDEKKDEEKKEEKKEEEKKPE